MAPANAKAVESGPGPFLTKHSSILGPRFRLLSPIAPTRHALLSSLQMRRLRKRKKSRHTASLFSISAGFNTSVRSPNILRRKCCASESESLMPSRRTQLACGSGINHGASPAARFSTPFWPCPINVEDPSSERNNGRVSHTSSARNE